MTSSPGTDAERPQDQHERVRAGADADGVRRLAVGREVGLEGLDVRRRG